MNKDRFINLKEDMALDVFLSNEGTFDDLKRLNIIFDFINNIIEDILKMINNIFKYKKIKIIEIVTYKNISGGFRK